jgi:hypothetical protein
LNFQDRQERLFRLGLLSGWLECEAKCAETEWRRGSLRREILGTLGEPRPVQRDVAIRERPYARACLVRMRRRDRPARMAERRAQ